MEHGALPAETDGGGCLVVGVWRCGVLEEGAREGVEREVRRALEAERCVCAWNIKKGLQEREGDVLVGFLGDGKGASEVWVERIKGVKVEGVATGAEVYLMERTLLSDGNT